VTVEMMVEVAVADGVAVVGCRSEPAAQWTVMNQKREEMAVAFAACEGLDLDIKQATDFCQDAIELESSIYVRWLCCSYLFVAWQRELTAFLCGCCRRARGDSLRTSASSS